MDVEGLTYVRDNMRLFIDSKNAFKNLLMPTRLKKTELFTIAALIERMKSCEFCDIDALERAKVDIYTELEKEEGHG